MKQGDGDGDDDDEEEEYIVGENEVKWLIMMMLMRKKMSST